MRTTFPLVPLAAAAPARALASVTLVLGSWFKAFARARRHRAEARALAGMEGRMLADMGITRADVRDAFSEPFWDDPTALLRERALERRLNRPAVRTIPIATGEPPAAVLYAAGDESPRTPDDLTNSGRSLSPAAAIRSAKSPLAAGSCARRPLRRAHYYSCPHAKICSESR